LKSQSFHYGWVILLSGMAVMFSCLGLGRFALGMLLPSMGGALELDYGQMGLIGTANFIGYMGSVFFAGRIAARFGARATIAAGLCTVGLSMCLIQAASGLWTALLPYVLTGVGSGLANIPMMGLVAGWFAKKWRGRAAGCMLIGNGLGIMFSGFLIPMLNRQLGPQGWRTGWLILGTIGALSGVLAALLLRNDPLRMGLKPMGAGPAAEAAGHGGGVDAGGHGAPELSKLVRIGLVYSLFGASYAVYATFIVTALVAERGVGEQAAGAFWSSVGLLSLGSGPLAGFISDRFGRFPALAVVFTQFTGAYLCALSGLPAGFLYLSIILFGLSLWGIPTIMTAAVGDMVGPARAASVFGFITIFFGAGQVLGPVVAGYIAEVTGLFDTAFLMCGILTAVGAVASVRMSRGVA
jgi:MFS family permease